MSKNGTANKYAELCFGARLHTYKPGRVCKWQGCTTILNSYHAGSYCHAHASSIEIKKQNRAAVQRYNRNRYWITKYRRQKAEEANAQKGEGLQPKDEVLQVVHETAGV